MHEFFMLDLLFAVLAAGALADCFLNGEIFSLYKLLLDEKVGGTEIRQLEDDDDDVITVEEEVPAWLSMLADWTPMFFARAWTCPYCIQWHASALALLNLLLVYMAGADTVLAYALRAPLYWWGAARILFLVDAFLPDSHRFDRGTDV